MFFRKKEDVQVERFEGFRSQTTYSCNGQLKTQFFDLTCPIDEDFIEYLKPFGYPVLRGGKLYEIQRDGFFRILLVPGRTNFHARFFKNCDPEAKTLLTRQVYRAVKNDLPADLPSRCPEDAISINDSILSINLKKCTYCLECV